MKLILAIIAMAILTSCEEVGTTQTLRCTKDNQMVVNEYRYNRNDTRVGMTHRYFLAIKAEKEQGGCVCTYTIE